MKKFYFLMSIFISVFIFSACKKEESNNFKILTSCYPINIITSNITKDASNIEVSSLSENNTGCLHNFQLKSEDLKKIEKSSVFIINGAGMESFFDKVLNEFPNLKSIDSSKNIKLIEEECHHHHHHDDNHNSEHKECHHHHEVNPHIWMSVSNNINQVKNISEDLQKLDSKNSEIYKKNSEIYVKKLENLKEKINIELSNVKNKNIITFHESFPYFAQEFDLNIVGVINHEPGEEPSIKEIKDIIENIKENNVKALFVEPQYNSNIASTIATETGTKVYTLDSAVTGDYSLDSYITAMENNLSVLKEALN